MLRTVMTLAIGLLVFGGCSSPPAQPEQPAASADTAPSDATGEAATSAPTTDEEMIKLALSAAPADVAANAAVVEPGEGGAMRQLRAGSNGYVCMAHPEVMCLDRQWQEWADAWINKREPKVTSLGIAYMLQGDKGASNIDPYATAQTPDNQWVVSPAHIMVLTPDTRQLDALPTDPANGGPWVMWKGTPYAHIMAPTVEMP
jgi:hypothetical protein